MRENMRAVLKAYMQSKPCRKAESVWTNGDHIYSYGTCLLAKLDDGRVAFNVTKYSRTTTVHQNALRGYVQDAGWPVVDVDGLYQGCSADHLRQRAIANA